jgi:hypothetical protein
MGVSIPHLQERALQRKVYPFPVFWIRLILVDMDEVETLKKPDAKPATPWYDSNLFWGPVGFVVTIVLALIVAMKHEFRWLLWGAWLVSIVPIWWLAKRTREVWLVLALGVVLSGAAFLGLNYWLRPSPAPAVAILPPVQVPASSQPKNDAHPSLPAIPPPRNPSAPKKKQHPSTSQVLKSPIALMLLENIVKSPAWIKTSPSGTSTSR